MEFKDLRLFAPLSACTESRLCRGCSMKSAPVEVVAMGCIPVLRGKTQTDYQDTIALRPSASHQPHAEGVDCAAGSR